jgi:histone demethylase JARID1
MHKPCPVFRPTAEEFADPIRYISSIRAIGEKAGICKIIAPEGWKPPFNPNKGKFRFTSKLQTLNALEGEARAQSEFVIRLRRFLFAQGTPMASFPTLGGPPLNLMKLYNAVLRRGGSEQVTKTKAWSLILKHDLGIKATSSLSQSLAKHYQTYLYRYELHQNQTFPAADGQAEEPSIPPSTGAQGRTSQAVQTNRPPPQLESALPTKKAKLTHGNAAPLETPPLDPAPASTPAHAPAPAPVPPLPDPAPAPATCSSTDAATSLSTHAATAKMERADSLREASAGKPSAGKPPTVAGAGGTAISSAAEVDAVVDAALDAIVDAAGTTNDAAIARALAGSDSPAGATVASTKAATDRPGAQATDRQGAHGAQARTTFYRCFADGRVLLTTVLQQ